MKKHIFLAVVCALTLVGCQNNETDCYFHKKTINRTVRQSDWQFDDKGKLFFCNFDVPEITRDVYDKGSWTVYREYNHNTPNAYQAAIPMNLFINDTLTEDAVVYYTQYIDFRIGIGYVEVQLTNSDYLYGEENPESMLFRLQANDVIRNLTVLHDDWQFDEGTKQYYYHFDVPEITSEVYNDGHWTISREYNYGTAEAYQVDLPMSCFMTDTLTENPIVRYTQQIDYVIGVGFFEVQLVNSDYFYDTVEGKPIPPKEMRFRLQLTY